MNIEPELAVINRVDFDGPSKEPPMSFFRGSLLISAIAVGLSAPAFAQPKADAGSGPTKGAISTDDAGSWPTKGAKPNADKTAAESMDTTEIVLA
jgi:hypothetical protein